MTYDKASISHGLWCSICVSFFIINLFLIVVQFANIQNDTRDWSCQMPNSMPPTQSPPPQPPPLPSPLAHFPELGVFHVLSPFLIFPTYFSPFPFIPFHYFLYSPNEWDHIMFVLLRLTHFTQHNTLQFHPRWSKWWVFVISNGWVISLEYIFNPYLP